MMRPLFVLAALIPTLAHAFEVNLAWDYTPDPRVTYFRIDADGVSATVVQGGNARAATIDASGGESITAVACSDTECSPPSNAVVVPIPEAPLSAPTNLRISATAPPPPQGEPVTLWDDSATPTVLADSDTTAVNLGVKFLTNQDGYVTGVRFYKSQQNTGTHVGALWTAGGQELGRITFTDETPQGWQAAYFAEPIPVVSDTVYVASYRAPRGRYSADAGYFNLPYGNGPLVAIGTGNGVYKYGALAFPDQTFNVTNYWVDVVFEPAG